ncbi:conjugal transfer protein [Aminobacter sp. MET-1]|uniref:conjugal transfer protein n=1 Tax=Aminobacter sp. MET-1 TaxID=2951085 RepID=UPI00226ADA9F|nr:conjugal transfer protein [Aminobacter sp. MET-1]MCX8571131.1 conjugal transfer protein [Aminobacter sp. MET-1]MCX8573200.1 conjugal transfer protein [Aminobacter sp. MET-1]
MKKIILSSAIGLLASTAVAYAQVPVTDAMNIQVNQQIQQLTSQIQSDTTVIKDNTTRTLQAITGDRTQDAGQFSSLATGSGFSMGQAPDFGSILQGNQASFGGIGGQFQNMAAQLINGLNLVKMVKDAATGGELSGANNAYNQGVQTVTTLTAMTDAMNAASKERTTAFTGAAGQIGKAQDLKGALEQNTQMVLQGNQTANEAVGALNNSVVLESQRYRAALAASSQSLKTFSKLPKKGAGGQQSNGKSVREQLQEFEVQSQ